MIKQVAILFILFNALSHFSQNRVEPYYDSISGCWGFITQKKGKIVIPAEYDYAVTNYAMYGGNDVARNKRTSLGYFVNKGGFYGLINHFGEFTYPLDTKDLWQLTTTTLISHSRKTGEIYLHINNEKEGQLMFNDVRFVETDLFENNYFASINHQDNTYSLIDSSGRIFYNHVYRPVTHILEECTVNEALGIDTCFDKFVYCKLDDTLLLYNLHKDQTIQLNNVERFWYYVKFDIAHVCNKVLSGGSEYLINLNNLKQTKFYDRINVHEGDPFGHYKSKVFPYFIVRENNPKSGFAYSFGLLDYDFKEVVPPIYNSLYPLPNGFITINNQHQAGVLSYSGDTIVPFEYRYLYDIDQHSLAFSKAFNSVSSSYELFGVMTVSGKILVTAKYKRVYPYNHYYTQYLDTLGKSYLAPIGEYNESKFISFRNEKEMQDSIPRRVNGYRNFKGANDHMIRIESTINVTQKNAIITDTISKSLYVAKTDSLYGLVDRKKRNITYFIYDKIEVMKVEESVSNQLLKMNIANEIKFYNTSNNEFVDGVFTFAHPMKGSNGEYVIAVKTNYVGGLIEEKFGVINLEGEVIIPFEHIWIDVINSTPENVVCKPFNDIKKEVEINLKND